MRVVVPGRDGYATSPEQVRPVLAAGFFDGVHRGHRLVLERAAARARELGAEAWVLTLDPHPGAVLSPDGGPRLLGSLAQRIDEFSALGMDACLVLPFTRALAARTPADFLLDVLPCAIGRLPREIFSGANWRFGHLGKGTPERIAALTGGRVASVVVPSVMDGDEPVSSTRIRNAVAAGDLSLAERLLGRPYEIEAVVEAGRRIGRTLGFPTANLAIGAQALPPAGVYAMDVAFDGERRRAVANLGIRPTFGDSAPGRLFLEAHLLDFDGDLYGKTLRATFRAFLRPERKFASAEALAAQLRADALAAAID